MTLAAVVVAFRDPSALHRCLDSLSSVEEVVVANVTADPDVRSVIAAAERVEVPIVDNVGYAAAVNTAVQSLSDDARWVLFMNDDVRVCSTPDTELSGGPVRVPKCISPSGSTVPTIHRLPSPAGFVVGWIFGRPAPIVGVGQMLPPGTFANGAAVLATREVLHQHPLPPEYFLYWEEAGWFWRLADADVAVTIDDFEIERADGRREFSPLKARLLGANLVRLGVERYGIGARLVYPVLGLVWVARLLATDLRAPDRRTRWQSRRATAWGLIWGPPVPSPDRGPA